MPREPLRRSQRPVDLWTTAKALAHRTNNKNRSGQLIPHFPDETDILSSEM